MTQTLSPVRFPSSTEMSPAGADVTVVICAYTLDRWPDLQSAVRSALAQQPPVHEVVVVVDHNPSLLKRAEACWPPQRKRPGSSVRVVANNNRCGLAGARNTGVAVACSEIVAFLDDDAEAEPGWIERLLAAYSNPDVVACGGAAVPRLGAPRPPWWPLEFDWVIGCSYVGLPTRTAAVRNIIGANMSIRRAAILSAGGFAEGIGRVGCRPLGCEETDLCIRLVQRHPGAVVVYEPSARVHHRVPAARLSWRYFRNRCYAEGLSKASVAANVGSERALASERSYVLTVLPFGVARALARAFRGERGAASQAMAITAGVAMTAAGYVTGRAVALVTGRLSTPRTRAVARRHRVALPVPVMRMPSALHPGGGA